MVPVHSLRKDCACEGAEAEEGKGTKPSSSAGAAFPLPAPLCPAYSQQVPPSATQRRASWLALGCPCRNVARSTQEIVIRK